MHKRLCKPIQVRIRFVPTKLLTIFASSLNKLILTMLTKMGKQSFCESFIQGKTFCETIYS